MIQQHLRTHVATASPVLGSSPKMTLLLQMQDAIKQEMQRNGLLEGGVPLQRNPSLPSNALQRSSSLSSNVSAYSSPRTPLAQMAIPSASPSPSNDDEPPPLISDPEDDDSSSEESSGEESSVSYKKNRK